MLRDGIVFANTFYNRMGQLLTIGTDDNKFVQVSYDMKPQKGGARFDNRIAAIDDIFLAFRLIMASKIVLTKYRDRLSMVNNNIMVNMVN